MQFFKITSYKTGNILSQGRFTSMRECLEHAIARNICLDHADLKNTNLTNASLDDACLIGADFSGANLTGANISESVLHGCKFDGAVLYNACLAWSDLQKCSFENTSFGATDITGCDISFSEFSALSCFSLDFSHTRRMNGCVFKAPSGYTSTFSHPPVVIKGLGMNPVILLDKHIQHGLEPMPYNELLRLLKAYISTQPVKRLTGTQ